MSKIKMMGLLVLIGNVSFCGGTDDWLVETAIIATAPSPTQEITERVKEKAKAVKEKVVQVAKTAKEILETDPPSLEKKEEIPPAYVD